MEPVLTALFVPGTHGERFDTALASGADAIIIDLEDAVAPGHKQQARDTAARWLLSSPEAAVSRTWVRLNSLGSPFFDEDAAFLGHLRHNDRFPAAVILPKAEHRESIDALGDLLPDACALIALIESGAGVEAASSLAQHDRVSRLAFGAADFAADTGCRMTEMSLLYARSVLVVASAAAGLEAPLDSPCFNIGDLATIEQHGRHGCELGFGGSLCIHPFQIAPIRTGYMPSEAERQWAERIHAAESSAGVTRVGDEMVDAPLFKRARRIMGERSEQ
ncbi:CoA ester lyase [Candidatus Aquiluna sp. UB-MaderosW2red]|uniref:HpcH/HpaI aldolase/citrate lyase family protein n=1 Tax=Candidatus Aquiluna sp. UB-MaderosW2red TaxID=1855377 RepID=UPI000875BE67|nr:CoA ester lyase [Candidatus Aquiluna sp. UB-MaderosW2red]SCX05239.1 citrate lyase subunit beta / citryl-CoA lyase [Candidatus Aquiluna sp. UB-MaderosW2red]